MAEEPQSENSPPTDQPQLSLTEHSTADYEKFAPAEKPIRNWTRIFSIFTTLILLIVIAIGAYWYLKHHKSTTTTNQSSQTVVSPPPASPQTPTVTTKSYTSANLNLTFSYPENWTVVDSGGGALTVTSPIASLKGPSGQDVNGKTIMTIRNSASSLPGFSHGNAAAVITSQKITYKNPTQTQKASTYVSFIAYASTGTNGLDAIYITGNNGFTQGQAVAQSDLLQANPIVSVTFFDANNKPLTIAASNWSNSSFSAPILNMLESLSIT